MQACRWLDAPFFITTTEQLPLQFRMLTMRLSIVSTVSSLLSASSSLIRTDKRGPVASCHYTELGLHHRCKVKYPVDKYPLSLAYWQSISRAARTPLKRSENDVNVWFWLNKLSLCIHYGPIWRYYIRARGREASIVKCVAIRLNSTQPQSDNRQLSFHYTSI